MTRKEFAAKMIEAAEAVDSNEKLNSDNRRTLIIQNIIALVGAQLCDLEEAITNNSDKIAKAIDHSLIGRGVPAKHSYAGNAGD